MKNPKRYTITAALPYTNGPVHIGHLAGVYVPADIYARYLRAKTKMLLLFAEVMNTVFQLPLEQKKKELLHNKL